MSLAEEIAKRRLYAVAVEIWKPNRRHPEGGEWHAHIVNLHADDRGHARAQYCLMHPNRNTHKIVDVAAVIGYFLEDKTEKDESVLVA
jgi:hypothetical protein